VGTEERISSGEPSLIVRRSEILEFVENFGINACVNEKGSRALPFENINIKVRGRRKDGSVNRKEQPKGREI